MILVAICEFRFHWKKEDINKNDDVSFAMVCTKQACFPTSGEYDL